MKMSNVNIKPMNPVEEMYRSIFMNEDMKWKSHPELRKYQVDLGNTSEIEKYVAYAHSPKEALEEATCYFIAIGSIDNEGNEVYNEIEKILYTCFPIKRIAVIQEIA